MTNGALFLETSYCLPPFFSPRNAGQVAKTLSHEHDDQMSSNDLIFYQFSHDLVEVGDATDFLKRFGRYRLPAGRQPGQTHEMSN
jgi:hypothetical protein